MFVVLATAIGYAIIAANTATQLPHFNSFIPTVYSLVFVTDLVTAILLFAQFRAAGATPLLVLAGGYLYSALVIVPHGLTFPGAFAETGLLGAGPQSAAWLNLSWRFGLGVSIALYAIIRTRNLLIRTVEPNARMSAIWWSVATVAITVIVVALVATAGHDFLPHVVADDRMLPLGRYANATIGLIDFVAVVLLLTKTRGRTILDLWLIVAAFALMAEAAVIALFVTARFTLGFYAIRAISVPVSKVVLVVLLWESVRLYSNLSLAVAQLRRERENRLTNAAAGLAAIAHQIRQPLAGVNLQASAGLRMLDQTPPDISAAQGHFAEIREASKKASEAFVDILGLLRGGREEAEAVDTNALIASATSLVRADLDRHGVTLSTTLAPDLPPVLGRAGQLREVILNLLQNSIEAMAASTSARTITFVTSRTDDGTISITFQDTGPCIAPHELATIFDPFVAAKSQGTGLGLAICQLIVEQHGGTLSAIAKEAGGAHFEIRLPSAP